jgi:hypothetical protein
MNRGGLLRSTDPLARVHRAIDIDETSLLAGYAKTKENQFSRENQSETQSLFQSWKEESHIFRAGPHEKAQEGHVPFEKEEKLRPPTSISIQT